MIVDRGDVTISGNTSDVHVKVKVIGQAGEVTNNQMKNWYERPLGITVIGLGVTVCGGGAIYLLGWN